MGSLPLAHNAEHFASYDLARLTVLYKPYGTSKIIFR